MSLKSKLTALISFLVLLVVFSTSALYLSSLARQALEEVGSKGEYVAYEVYHQAQTVLSAARMPPGSNPSDPQQLKAFVRRTLASDPGISSLMESAVGYSATVYDVAITDVDGTALVNTNPDEIGRAATPRKSFNDLIHSGALRQLRAIYGPPEVYDVVLPLELGGQTFAVRVGVSTVFLRSTINPELRDALALALLVILLATVSAGVVSFRLLRPLEAISRNVDRLARGERIENLRLGRKDEWGILSSKLNLLGEQMRGEKAAFVALKENLNQLFSNLSDGLLFFDKDDRLAVATPAVSRFLNRPTSGLVHRTAGEVFSSEGRLDVFLRDAFSKRQSVPWQVVDLGDTAEIHRVAVNLQFVEEAGETGASLVTLRDATTRAQLEDQIDVTTKLAALGRLTSGVAHEVKNPLNAMVLQLEILKSKLRGEDERVKPQIEILSSEIHRLDRVVKTFLDFTRPVELHPSATNLEELVREVFTVAEPQARLNKVRLVLETNGAPPALRLDRDLMKQALLNLVLNGCQAMPAGGELRVTPRAMARQVSLEIADQGAGIPAEIREKIFSLFFTTKPGGSGVGLALAYRIIQLHNGSIEFSTELGQGTTFRVSLPRS